MDSVYYIWFNIKNKNSHLNLFLFVICIILLCGKNNDDDG